MSTTSTIGTSSRNYSTVSAWLTAFAAGGWIGQCYNDSEFAVSGTVADFSGHSTNSSDYITLTTAAGQSFIDNANAQTNALAYNQTNGVGLKRNGGYGPIINITEQYVTVSKIQASHSISFQGLDSHSSGGNCIIDRCIFYGNCFSGATTFTNTLITVGNFGGSQSGIDCRYGGAITAVNCTIVAPSDVSDTGNALRSYTGGNTIVNCALFGFSGSANDPSKFTGNNNASDQTIGFGSSNQASKTYANQFVNKLLATMDYRAKAAADILDNGSTATGTGGMTAIDIVGTTRPQGSAWDIGCWELIVAASVTALAKARNINQAVKRASFW